MLNLLLHVSHADTGDLGMLSLPSCICFGYKFLLTIMPNYLVLLFFMVNCGGILMWHMLYIRDNWTWAWLLVSHWVGESLAWLPLFVMNIDNRGMLSNFMLTTLDFFPLILMLPDVACFCVCFPLHDFLQGLYVYRTTFTHFLDPAAESQGKEQNGLRKLFDFVYFFSFVQA